MRADEVSGENATDGQVEERLEEREEILGGQLHPLYVIGNKIYHSTNVEICRRFHANVKHLERVQIQTGSY